MSYCKNCGCSLEAYAAFCPNCGKAVESTPEPVSPTTPDNSCQIPPVVYDLAAFTIAKEHISAVRSAFGLSITALILMLSIIPAGLLLILIPFSTFLLICMGIAAFICAIVSGTKLGKANKLPAVNPGSIDPVSFATYQKSLNDEKSAKVMNTVVLVLFALAVLAVIAFVVVFVLFGAGLFGIVDGANSFSGPAYYY